MARRQIRPLLVWGYGDRIQTDGENFKHMKGEERVSKRSGMSEGGGGRREREGDERDERERERES